MDVLTNPLVLAFFGMDVLIAVVQFARCAQTVRKETRTLYGDKLPAPPDRSREQEKVAA